ncbi:hypothetical protein BD408DRAFT_421089 [Parasitella parasitica]|nr:hypothetical protein BD408DRAFT_421089 [Parasitella parasitica]
MTPRLSSSASSSHSYISHMANTSPGNQDNVITNLPKPSSLLLKRLAPKHGYKKNLTILTPSYNGHDDVHANSIQSAPLRRSTIPPFNKNNKISKKPSPLPSFLTVKSLNSRRLVAPATASAASAPWPKTSAQATFPSPPIVPSQQPTWGQYRQQRQNKLKPAIKTATMPYFPRTPVTSSSNANNAPIPSSLSQKQKFLQPFEFLYDHIEQTRTLKTTLDDHIRRSSTLIQTLQSSSATVEYLVRRQVRDVMDQRFEIKLKECTERLARLEQRLPTKDIPISPSISPSLRRPKMAASTEPIQNLISQLMNRIDHLETKLKKQ